MLKEEFKKSLTETIKKENVEGLISFMEKSGIEYHMADLRGPLAMATFYGIFIDLKRIMEQAWLGDTKLIYFIILHEIAHIKRMKKLGKDKVLSKLSLENFDEFFNHILEEELIADRYGCYVFNKLNNEEYPYWMTQQLNLEFKQEQYKQTTRGFFGRIQNSEEKYKQFVEQFIIKRY